MEYFKETNIVNNDIVSCIEKFEPNSRTYAMNYVPTNLTVWNKKAIGCEIKYGVKPVVKKKTKK